MLSNDPKTNSRKCTKRLQCDPHARIILATTTGKYLSILFCWGVVGLFDKVCLQLFVSLLSPFSPLTLCSFLTLCFISPLVPTLSPMAEAMVTTTMKVPRAIPSREATVKSEQGPREAPSSCRVRVLHRVLFPVLVRPFARALVPALCQGRRQVRLRHHREPDRSTFSPCSFPRL